MKTVVTTTPTVSGWNYNVYLHCDTNSDGEPMTDTATKTIDGWAVTQDKAAELGSNKAHELLEE